MFILNWQPFARPHADRQSRSETPDFRFIEDKRFVVLEFARMRSARSRGRGPERTGRPGAGPALSAPSSARGAPGASKSRRFAALGGRGPGRHGVRLPGSVGFHCVKPMRQGRVGM